jgi:hypothetical protein
MSSGNTMQVMPNGEVVCVEGNDDRPIPEIDFGDGRNDSARNSEAEGEESIKTTLPGSNSNKIRSGKEEDNYPVTGDDSGAGTYASANRNSETEGEEGISTTLPGTNSNKISRVEEDVDPLNPVESFGAHRNASAKYDETEGEESISTTLPGSNSNKIPSGE